MDETELAESLEILRTDPTTRTKDQVLHLAALTLKLSYFREIQREYRFSHLHKLACSKMTLQTCPEGHVVVKHGDYADAFYIVLKGNLGVLVPKRKNKVATEPDDDEERHPSHRDDHADVRMIEVAHITDGGHFGELSLLRGIARTATVECKTDAALGVLSVKGFRVSLGVFEERKLNYKINFLQSLPVFNQWTKTAISKMTYFLQIHSCSSGSVLYRERHDSDSVYIVERGEFRLTQQAMIKQESSERLRFLYGPGRTKGEHSLKPLMKQRVKTTRKDLQVRLA